MKKRMVMMMTLIIRGEGGAWVREGSSWPKPALCWMERLLPISELSSSLLLPSHTIVKSFHKRCP